MKRCLLLGKAVAGADDAVVEVRVGAAQGGAKARVLDIVKFNRERAYAEGSRRANAHLKADMQSDRASAGKARSGGVRSGGAQDAVVAKVLEAR